MEFRIRNKNKPASNNVSDIESFIAYLLLMIVYLIIAISIISNSPLKNFINTEAPDLSDLVVIGVTLLFVITLTIFTLIPVYSFINQYKVTHYPENMGEKIKDSLNTPYVDKKDKETVYLLHELIKKYGIEHSKNDQHNHFYLELDLKDHGQYDKIDYDQYDDDEKDVIYDVTKYKKLTENEAIQFFDQYIRNYSYPKIRSIEERNELKQRIMNKSL